MKLTILYRGPLASCNYGCRYCPFAKHTETAVEHETDRRALERFTGWVATRTADRIAVFFTPWGEALIRSRYQQAIIQLTRLEHVTKVAIQTNLSCRLDWVEQCDKAKLALWATYHPTQVVRANFHARCNELDRRGVRFSVGMVGMQEHLDEIEMLRRELPEHIYLWVNAYKRVANYYTPEQHRRLTAVDPLFPINARNYPSFGRSCRAGSSVIAVDGDGTIRRCHFVRTPIGNIYHPDFDLALRERPCPKMTCGCHTGYVHLDYLELEQVFGDGLLERIPVDALWRSR